MPELFKPPSRIAADNFFRWLDESRTSQKQAASLLGIQPQGVSNWRSRGIPHKRVQLQDLRCGSQSFRAGKRIERWVGGRATPAQAERLFQVCKADLQSAAGCLPNLPYRWVGICSTGLEKILPILRDNSRWA